MKVDEFEYPGLTIHSNRRGECRLERGARVICNRRTAVRSKGKIYRKVVRPAMMHLLDPLKKKSVRAEGAEIFSGSERSGRD